MLIALPHVGYAGPAGFAPEDLLNECTEEPFFDYDSEEVQGVQRVLQDTVDEINDTVQAASKEVYAALIGSPGYRGTIMAAFTLMLIFFAVSFMFGFVTLTLLQGVVRLLKIGLVFWIATPDAFLTIPILGIGTDPTGSSLIDGIFVRFFNEGGAYLINAMINIATTGVVGNPGSSVTAPFSVLDEILRIVFSSRMVVTIIATLSAGPFGPLMAGALMWAVFSIFMATLKALQIYAISIVIKAVLLGLAPVFIPMILFDKTKPMFMGWINQLVNFTLQPILLFAFLAFFSTLVESAARDILPEDDVHVCYVKAENQASTAIDTHNWKYMCCLEGQPCVPHEGKITFEGMQGCGEGDAQKQFPLNHINVLTFLLLTHIMKQLTTVAVTMAAELSQGMIKLTDYGNSINEYFGGARGGGGGISDHRHFKK